MSSVNKVTLLGRLGKDPEIRQMNNGDSVANFSLATSEKWKDNNGEAQERTEWHRVVVFGKMAGIVEKYLKKGDQAYFEGRLQTKKYTDKQGNDKYSTEVIVTGFGGKLVLLGGGSTAARGEYGGGSTRQSDNGYPDDEIPF